MFITLFITTLLSTSANAEEPKPEKDRECQLMGVGANQPAIEKLCLELKATKAELAEADKRIAELEYAQRRIHEDVSLINARLGDLELNQSKSLK